MDQIIFQFFSTKDSREFVGDLFRGQLPPDVGVRRARGVPRDRVCDNGHEDGKRKR